ncbi:hypothetical protein [Roseovarius sp. A46]|uniref:hypothetical protein n=1 Tax=Roseovarius sp. A46 TaxID=2109331 RepID=UPI001F5093F4|nr:hypothetical protein [Roseovarius sp. A46]
MVNLYKAFAKGSIPVFEIELARHAIETVKRDSIISQFGIPLLANRNVYFLTTFGSCLWIMNSAFCGSRQAGHESKNKTFKLVVRPCPPFVVNTLKAGAQWRLVTIPIDPPDPAIVEESVKYITCILHAVTEGPW